MTQQTFNIIMACKGNLFGKVPVAADRVRHYMADGCGCDIYDYSDSIVESILFEAVADYLDSCDKPSAFLRECKWLASLPVYNTSVEIMAAALTNVQVRDNSGYVNGFTDELYRKIRKEN